MPQICSKLNTRVPRRLTWAEVNSSPAQAMESRGEITTILRSLAMCSQLWKGAQANFGMQSFRSVSEHTVHKPKLYADPARAKSAADL